MWPHLGADERVDRSTQLQVQNGSARLMLDATTHKKLVGNPGNRPNPVLPSPKKIMVRLWGIIPFYGLKIQVSEIWWYFYPEFGDYSNFIEQGMNVRMCECAVASTRAKLKSTQMTHAAASVFWGSRGWRGFAETLLVPQKGADGQKWLTLW
jgi:hypothetical protein